MGSVVLITENCLFCLVINVGFAGGECSHFNVEVALKSLFELPKVLGLSAIQLKVFVCLSLITIADKFVYLAAFGTHLHSTLVLLF